MLEFLPQLLFLILLFFYMTVLMFVKWSLYDAIYKGEHRERQLLQIFQSILLIILRVAVDVGPRSPTCAPSVLITFINMMLFKHASMAPGCSEYMFEGQYILQMICFFSAILCIPVMLFGKPLYILSTKKKRKHPGKVVVSNLLSYRAIYLILCHVLLSVTIGINFEREIEHFILYRQMGGSVFILFFTVLLMFWRISLDPRATCVYV